MEIRASPRVERDHDKWRKKGIFECAVGAVMFYGRLSECQNSRQYEVTLLFTVRRVTITLLDTCVWANFSPPGGKEIFANDNVKEKKPETAK